MKNQDAWVPTKFQEVQPGVWRGSRDPRHLAPSSRLYADRSVAAYQRALAEHAHGDLADLGCGLVPLFGMYRERVSSVTCADWPSSQHRSPYLDYEVDLSKPLDQFKDDSFDTVVLSDVLEHLPNPVSTLEEVDRILRPGGVLILGVPFMYWLHEVPRDYHRYTRYLLRLRLEELGHEVIKIEQFCGPLEVIFDTLGKSLGAAGAPRSIVAAEQALGLRLGRLIPESVRARADVVMPTGYLVVSRAARPA